MGNLFNSSVVEMALGLVFIYFLLSIVCSSINEFFAGLMKWRARDLERGLVNLIRDPEKAKSVLNNPLVVAMGSRNTEPVLVKLLAGNRQEHEGKVYLKNTIVQSGGGVKEPLRKNYAGKPSYIPSRSFVLALLDTLVGGENLNIQSIRNAAKELVDQTGRPDDQTKDPNQEALGKTLLLLLDDSKNAGKLVIGLDDVRHMVEALPDTAEKAQVMEWIKDLKNIDGLRDKVLQLDEASAVRRTVLNALSIGLTDLEAFKLRAEGWYDSAMDRISGVYKRRIQIYLFAFGLLVSFLVGADSLQIATALYSNSAVRQALIANVSKATTPGGEFYFNPTSGQDSNDANTISVISSTVALTSKDNITTTTSTVSLPNAQKVVDELNSFGQLFSYDAFWDEMGKGDVWRGLALVAGKILGLAITAFAISFGAPFWFDLLNKIVNLRAGVKPSK